MPDEKPPEPPATAESHQVPGLLPLPKAAISPPCGAPGCKNDATHWPVLLLVPNSSYKGEPWRVVVQVPFCGEHCLKGEPQQYLIDAMWIDLTSRARARGQVPPKRKLTRVEFVPIGSEGRA